MQFSANNAVGAGIARPEGFQQAKYCWATRGGVKTSPYKVTINVVLYIAKNARTIKKMVRAFFYKSSVKIAFCTTIPAGVSRKVCSSNVA